MAFIFGSFNFVICVLRYHISTLIKISSKLVHIVAVLFQFFVGNYCWVLQRVRKSTPKIKTRSAPYFYKSCNLEKPFCHVLIISIINSFSKFNTVFKYSVSIFFICYIYIMSALYISQSPLACYESYSIDGTDPLTIQARETDSWSFLWIIHPRW